MHTLMRIGINLISRCCLSLSHYFYFFFFAILFKSLLKMCIYWYCLSFFSLSTRKNYLFIDRMLMLQYSKHGECILQEIGAAFRGEHPADLEIICDGSKSTLRAHKLVLAAASPLIRSVRSPKKKNKTTTTSSCWKPWNETYITLIFIIFFSQLKNNFGRYSMSPQWWTHHHSFSRHSH